MRHRAPDLDTRRAAEFEAELLARARSWIPGWSLEEGGQDFGQALLAIAARFDAEVAERLDDAGDKMHRGFLDWLGIRGEAARPARMPVVLKMVEKATEAQLARAPARMQADVDNASVSFETERDLRVMPGRLELVVATDAAADAIFLPPPGFTSIDPAPPAPRQWRLKSFAAAGAEKLQVEPAEGLQEGTLLQVDRAQYEVRGVEKDIVTIAPRLDAAASAGTVVDKVATFEPFGPHARNRQLHALYIGHADLLNIDAAATLDVVGAQDLAGAAWSYWGKAGDAEAEAWQPLALAGDQPADAVRLEKPAGAVVPRDVANVKGSRWIRAASPRVAGDRPGLVADEITLRINPQALPACPIKGSAPPGPAAQAMANTTPLVLSNFYPLGKTPRQFDTFYLGSAEAFSKDGAEVQLCFALGDPSCKSFAAIRTGPFADRIVASVGQDQALHLFEVDAATGALSDLANRGPLQPPSPAEGGAAKSAPPVLLDAAPAWRLPAWSEGADFLVAVAAGRKAWVWHELAGTPTRSGWLGFNEVPASAPGDVVTALVHLEAAGKLLALRSDGLVFSRDDGGDDEWAPIANGLPGNETWASIAPVFKVDAASRIVSSDRFVGVSDAGALYFADLQGNAAPMPGPVGTAFSLLVQPVAWMEGAIAIAVAPLSGLAQLAASGYDTANNIGASLGERALPGGATVAGGSLELVVDGGNFAALACVRNGGAARLVAWTPAATAPRDQLFGTVISGAAGAEGAPTAVAGRVLVPARGGDVVSAPLDLARRSVLEGDFGTGVAIPGAATPLASGDVVSIVIGTTTELAEVTDGPHLSGAEAFHSISNDFSVGSVTREALAYRISGAKTGAPGANADQLDLEAGDLRAEVDLFVLVAAGSNPLREYRITAVSTDPATNVTTVDLHDVLPAIAAGETIEYWLPENLGLRVAPVVKLQPSMPNERLESAVADASAFLFASALPSPQRGRTFEAIGAYVRRFVFDQPWTAAPAIGAQEFVLDGSVGAWTLQSGDTSSNPELSWEYWNGAWSRLEAEDETGNLKSSGAVRFTVPGDIRASDWAGKTDFWIRARLVGGDYGTEQVTVEVEDLGGGKSRQTVVRSSEGITAPIVVSLAISYRIAEGILPQHVLAEDSGSTRDQSDANATPNARVEAFVPLALALGRLRSRGGDGTTAPEPPCPPACDCGGGPAATPGPPAIPVASAVTPATGRALFLGFSRPVDGASVNTLFITEREADHDAFAQLQVETLVADRLAAVTAEDGTRALGETGLLTLAFGEAPTKAELFGQALFWVRVAPSGTDHANWSPNLAGAYLNGAWVSATETLTRELLGSSEGAPGLILRLARPPVLEGSLELRVREPLGDEERKELDDAGLVLHDVALAGDWVLWKQVVDPLDEDPGARVYALEEREGLIRFGDGAHGRIPPLGRDNIVAFRYRRTEPPVPGRMAVPANAVTARSGLNLVAPVAGVEAVFAADDAAGGSPAQPDESVIRDGAARLRHRGRALTARDFEDLAIASSPRIVQARAWTRTRGARLVVVMQGNDPKPSRAEVRELERRLLAVAPAAFGPDSIRIEGPRVRALRVALNVVVDRLDNGAGVREQAARNLLRRFDAANGGDGEGWPLGVTAREQDVALALDRIPHLESISGVVLTEVLEDGGVGPWPVSIAPDELVRLADADIRMAFDRAGVAA